MVWVCYCGNCIFRKNDCWMAHEQDIFAEIWPTNLHGLIGPLGLILLFIVVRFGKKAKENRLAGKSFATEKTKHGRAADFIMALIFIHAFLGFLYIFSVI